MVIMSCNTSMHVLFNVGKFEVVFLSSAIGHELSVLVVMLKSFSQMNYYLAINQKGKIKMTKVSVEIKLASL